MIMFSLKLTGQIPFKEVFCHGLIRDSDGRKMSKSLGNVIDPIDILDGISLDELHQKLLQGNLAQSEVKNAERYQKKVSCNLLYTRALPFAASSKIYYLPYAHVLQAFPQGIPEIGADALRFSLVNYTQASGNDINFDIKTMHSYRRFCNKIYQATKYVLGKLGEDFVPRETSALTGKESLPEKWILTKMNSAAKQINRALEEREFARSTQISYRYLYDELFAIYIENSKSIISEGTTEEARSAIDTLYTTLETGLRLLAPFMPFLTEELWQRLPRRPGDDTISITIAHYPEYDPSLDDARSETAYELVLGCSKGIRSLMVEYAIKDKGVAYIAPLSQMSQDTITAQISAIESLSGKTPVEIAILQVGEGITTNCRCVVFPVSADANVYLLVQDRIHDVRKEVEKYQERFDAAEKDRREIESIRADMMKVQNKDVTDALQVVEVRKRDVEARLRALQETVTMFETMKV